MYDRGVTQRNLELASQEIAKRHALPAKWQLEPSTPGEIAEMVAHLDGLLDDKGVPRRDLTREEGLWVLCEATLCKNDFEYYATNYARIVNWESRVVPFVANKAQRIMTDVVAEMERARWAVLIQSLKARQLGITTWAQVLLSHRTFFWRNVTTMTGSAEPDKSKEMVGKLEFIYDNLPWWLRPLRTAYRAGELLEYGHLNSTINVHWGNQKQGIGRGNTATVAHLSELASFLDPAALVDASLMKTMHENPFGLLILESTAEGIGNWWHKTWLTNVEMEAHGLAKQKPVFLPWFVGTDIYPTEGWLRRRPVPEGWQPPQHVEAHAQACEVYARQAPLLVKYLGAEWRMPLEQKWWYFVEHMEATKKGELHLFLQELASNPDEAFQNSNPTIFSVETMQEVRTASQAATPTAVLEIAGRDIPPTYKLGGHVGPAMLARCTRPSGELINTFDLWPLQLGGWPDFDPECRLYVWEWPQAGEEYGIGLDPAEGVDQDRSVIQGIKKATPWHPDEQVAEWASARVTPNDLWPYVFALAHLYTARSRTGRWVTPRVVIEINIAAGDKVQTEMAKRGWTNFHRQVDMTRAPKGRRKGWQRQADPRELGKLGWKTDRVNRPGIIAEMRAAIRDGTFRVRSPWLARELATLEYNLDRKRIEASQGNHDDRFFAAGIVLSSWYGAGVYGSVPSAWTGEREWERQLVDKPRYTVGEVVGGAAPRPMADVKRWDGRQAAYGTLMGEE